MKESKLYLPWINKMSDHHCRCFCLLISFPPSSPLLNFIVLLHSDCLSKTIYFVLFLLVRVDRRCCGLIWDNCKPLQLSSWPACSFGSLTVFSSNWHVFPSVACKHSVHLAGNTAKFQNLDALSFQLPWDCTLILSHLWSWVPSAAGFFLSSFPLYGGVCVWSLSVQTESPHGCQQRNSIKNKCPLTASGAVEVQIQK